MPRSKNGSTGTTVEDWLHGVRIANPDDNLYRSLRSEPLTQAERIRLVYNLLTSASPNGVGLTPKLGEWEMVDSIFPLHDNEFDREWLHRISGKWAIDDHELDIIRAQFGEKLAFYFAFLQSYFLWLIIPSLAGIFSYIFLPGYSILFSIAIGTWSVVFVEIWRRREIDLAVRWGVNGCSALEHQRAAFVARKESNKEPTEQNLFFKRLSRRVAAVPVALIAGLILSVILSVIFSIEVFLNEQFLLGKQKFYLKIMAYIPTVLFASIVPVFSRLYTNISQRLTISEDHETDASFETAWTNKVFLLNFLTGYMSLFLTAYIYVPFGRDVVPRLDFLSLAGTSTSQGFEINPSRLRHQLIYYLVTAQALNAFSQLAVPYLMGRATTEAKKLQNKITKRPIAESSWYRKSEAAFLEYARNEVNLPEYEIYTDFCEMVIQFGYIVLFGAIWPLTPLCALANNLFESRTDAAKLCINVKRPVPSRVDSIGPWLDILSFLCFLGSIVSSSIVYLFRGSEPSNKSLVSMMIVIFFSENIFFMVQSFIRSISKAVPTSGQRQISYKLFANRMVYYERLQKRISTENLASGSKIQSPSAGNFWAVVDSDIEVISHIEKINEKKNS